MSLTPTICWTSFVTSIAITTALVQCFFTSSSPGLHTYLSPHHSPSTSFHWDCFSVWLRIFQQLHFLHRIRGTFPIIKAYKVLHDLTTAYSHHPLICILIPVIMNCFTITFTFFHSVLLLYIPFRLSWKPSSSCLLGELLPIPQSSAQFSPQCSVQAEWVTSPLCSQFVFRSSVVTPTMLYDTVFITSLSFSLEDGLHKGRLSVFLFSAF